MKHRNNLLFLLLCIWFLIACNPQPEAPQLLERAQALMDTHPDSSMLLIDSIFYPEGSLNRKQYMRYLVTRVQARYKNYRPVAEDTLIFAARDYFEKKGKDPAQIAMAYFYSGCVYREQNNCNRAMQQYKDAEQYAAKTNDVDLKGLIQYNMGDLYYDKMSFTLALEKYQQAEQFCADNDEKLMQCVLATAQTFMLLDDLDNAFLYFNKGVELATDIEDRKKLSTFLQGISVAYSQKGDHVSALRYLKQSFSLNVDSTEIPRYYLNFANIYQGLGRQDSVSFYHNILQQTAHKLSDVYLKYSVYDFLAQTEQQKGDYRDAYTHLQKKDSCIVEIMKTTNVKALAEAERKYDVALHRAEKEKANARSSKILLVLLAAVLTLVLLAGLSYYLSQKHRQEKKKGDLLKQKADKAVYINTVYQNTVNNITELKNKIVDLAAKYSIKEPEHDTGYDEIIKTLKQIETDALSGYAAYIANFLHSQQILTSEQTEVLKEEDQLLVSLIHCNYTRSDIASILRIKPHALTTRKARLKDKLSKAGLTTEQISQILRTKQV